MENRYNDDYYNDDDVYNNDDNNYNYNYNNYNYNSYASFCNINGWRNRNKDGDI